MIYCKIFIQTIYCKYIAFKVEDSDNVLKGKLASGIKAISNIEIDLTDTNIPVDICVEIDDSNLSSSFKLTTTLDGKIYNLGTTEKIKIEKEKGFKHNKSNDKKILRLELEWIDNIEKNEIDTILGANAGSLIIPVKITVKQHI
ncbi:MAG TPA: hypothetical protein DCE23_09225 [Firmicutes bacterium]|nr:hypothetical protein [Bacillota bacterium]